MKTLVKQGWGPLMVIILLFAIWEICVQLFELPTWLLPAPTQILEVGVTEWSQYSHHVWATVQLIVVGFAIGSGIGVLVAIALHLVPFLRQATYPLMILSQNIPVIVLAPLLVVWFGFGMLPKIIVITLVCFFPIAISLLDGFRQTDRDLMHYMQMAGANRKQLFWKLEWPHALPSLFSGLKISATYSVMGAVISEWLGASRGIGYYMTLASSSYRTDRVFVAIMIIVALSLIFFILINWIENRAIKWRSTREGGANEAS